MRKVHWLPEMEAKAVRGGDTSVKPKPKPPEHHVRDQEEGRGLWLGRLLGSVCQSPFFLTGCSLLVNRSVCFSHMGASQLALTFYPPAPGALAPKFM